MFSRSSYDPKTKLARFNSFLATYIYITTNLLPPPYTTKCRNYRESGLSSQNDCMRQCLIWETTINFSKYPFSTLLRLTKPRKFPHLNQWDLDNHTLAQQLTAMEIDCRKNCQSRDCHQTYSLTAIDRDTEQNYFAITVSIQNSPSFQIDFTPKIRFPQFLIHITTLLSTCLGFSILGTLPHLKNFGNRLTKFVGWEQKDRKRNFANCHNCETTRKMLRAELTKSIARLRNQVQTWF